ncbi:MAG: hypothetical protein ACI915_003203, partial [Gammaproteobacteria bacterium]
LGGFFSNMVRASFLHDAHPDMRIRCLACFDVTPCRRHLLDLPGGVWLLRRSSFYSISARNWPSTSS